MREKLMRLMYGRYGVDSLSKFLLVLAVLCFLLRGWLRMPLFAVLAFALLIYIYYRMLSRDYAKRSAENQKFLQLTGRVRRFFDRQRWMLGQQKTHHIYKCPSCKQKIRVPRGKGKIEIRCPKCGTTFIKRS